MARPIARGAGTRRALVKLLKTEGPMDSAALAARLGVTPMAVRQHLYALQEEKLVRAEERPVPLGRPAKYWQLTPEASRLFPDAYAELNVALIGAVETAFGRKGVERLLETRLATQRSEYAARIDRSAPLDRKLQQLARLRTEEGYMAEVKRDGRSGFLFLENHCPILRRGDRVSRILFNGAGAVPRRPRARCPRRADGAHPFRRSPLRLPRCAQARGAMMTTCVPWA